MNGIKFNDFYIYNQNITLAAGATLVFQHKMNEDFYLFDIAGVDSVATGENLRLRIRDTNAKRNLMNTPLRAGLAAAMLSGDSAWYFPTLLPKGHVIEIEATLDAGVPGVNFDLALVGFNHTGGTPAHCAPPRNLFWYAWEFEDIALATQEVQTIRVLNDRNFVAVGYVSTDVCTTVDLLTFDIRNETLGYKWMNQAVMGSALFPGIANTVRRNRFRIPVTLSAGSLVTATVTNTSAVANALNVAFALYGYHVERSTRVNR
jgi:hypothetical protein